MYLPLRYRLRPSCLRCAGRAWPCRRGAGVDFMKPFRQKFTVKPNQVEFKFVIMTLDIWH
jgi:hypothetical protein